MPTVIESLARNKIAEFITNYLEVSREIFTNEEDRLSHASEFGGYRERLLKELLSCFLPSYYSYGEGFVINKDSQRSTQCDVIIYDQRETPKLESNDLRRFYPLETVFSVGEVKSCMTLPLLKEALKKLSYIKKLRQVEPQTTMPLNPIQVDLNAPHRTRYTEELFEANPDEYFTLKFWNPDNNEHQNIVSFLVCESIVLGGKSMIDIVRDLYPANMDGISIRHNFILSINDGFLSYSNPDEDKKLIPYNFPKCGDVSTAYRFVEPTNGDHLIAFISSLASALNQTLIYPFDVASYMGEFNEQTAPMGD
jgi:hypothetical protein